VHQQAQRWIAAGVFEALVHDLWAVLRLADDRAPQPSAIVLDARTLQSSCESGGRAGYDGAKRRRGSKVHMAVDTLGQLLALRVTPANEDYGITGNSRCLVSFRHKVLLSWHKWLNRRSRGNQLTWQRFISMLNGNLDLPPARIVHSARAAKP
jgi:hypothetical protein